MGHTSGTIQVREHEAFPFDAQVGTKLQLIHLREEFFGDLAGILTARFVQVVTMNGSAQQWGAGRFVGTLAGRRGSFVIEDAGIVRGDHVDGTWSVIAGSGTGELSGLSGKATFTGTLGQAASYAFEYAFV
jgi:hypothetical protein